MKHLLILILIALTASAFAQDIVDVSDPQAIKLKTPDQGVVIAGTLHDTMANYPKLAQKLKDETAKKMEAADEITAQRMFMQIAGQKVDLGKATIDKHNARIAKFAKAKEDAINAAIKKGQDMIRGVKFDTTDSQSDIGAKLKALEDGRALVLKAKARKDELVSLSIPVSKPTQDAVEKAQPKATPAPAQPLATPDDGL